MTTTGERAETRVFYQDTKPYDVPARLDELREPGSGRMELTVNVYWVRRRSSTSTRCAGW